MKFGRRGKLSLWYIGAFEILRQVGPVAYELALPLPYSTIHLMFHVLMLRQYIPDESHELRYDTVELDDCLTFIEQLVVVLAKNTR